MKIIKRTDAGNLVVFAGASLALNGQVVSGNGWSYTAPVDWVMVIEDAVLPNGYVASGWTYTGGVWTINATGAADAFPWRRKAKIAFLVAAADEAEYADITHNSIVWPADESTRYVLTEYMAVGAVPEGMYWRDAEGTPRTVTFEELQALALAIMTRALAVDVQLTTRMAEVAAANTISAIEAVTWD